MRSLSIEYLPVGQLRPYPGNPRTHSKRQIRKITHSLQRFGWTNPLLISDDGEIIAGHGRFEAAKLLGLASVPTVRLSHLSPEERRAYVIADNRLAELAGWDPKTLAIELQGLADLNFDVTLTGFEMGEIDLLFAEAEEKNDTRPDPTDTIEELDFGAPAVCRPGDLWCLDPHLVICGDARSPEIYSQLLGEAAIDVVIADPPFNTKIQGHVSGLGKVRHAEFAFASGEMNEREFATFLTESFGLVKDYSRDGAMWFVFMDAGHNYELLHAVRRIGVKLKTTCVWAKTNAGMGSLYRSQVEFVHVFKVGTAPHVNNVDLGRFGRSRTTLWTYAGANTFRKGRMDDLKAHPTVKPLALVADAIRDVSNRGDLVLDPFLGSGTTLLAAEKTGRIGRGIEFEPRYVDCAIRRWQTYTGREATLSTTGETFETIEEQRLGQVEPRDSESRATPRSRRRIGSQNAASRKVS